MNDHFTSSIYRANQHISSKAEKKGWKLSRCEFTSIDDEKHDNGLPTQSVGPEISKP